MTRARLPGRRAFFTAAGAAGVGLVAARLHTRRARLRIERFSVPVRGLPTDLQGFRIVLISDLHAGPFLDATVIDRVVTQVNARGPDLVVLGGDMVDGHASQGEIESCFHRLGGLRAREGVVAVLGNHEYFAGVETVLAVLARSEITLLRGSHVLLERGSSAIAVLGVDDPRLSRFDPPQDQAVDAVAAEAPVGAVTVLVAHRPAAFDAAARLGIPLTLSGHTHGGQIGLLLRDLTPVRAVTRYVRGAYRTGESHLVVSTGVGTSGVPLRVGVPPSIAEVTLVTPTP